MQLCETLAHDPAQPTQSFLHSYTESTDLYIQLGN